MSIVTKKSIPDKKSKSVAFIKKELHDQFYKFFGNGTTELCGEAGPDTWMGGDLSIYKDGNYLCEFGISYLNMSNVTIVTK